MLMITTNFVMKINIFVMNHESRPVMSNTVYYQKKRLEKWIHHNDVTITITFDFTFKHTLPASKYLIYKTK